VRSQESIREQADRPLELIERELEQLAAQIAAGTCRWLELVAEYDRREGWAHWGCRSCAHWVSWRCQIAPAAAREHVRVARCLARLPLIRDAFAAGRLSYSKVRALTRVGEVAREAELLELAEHATAAQLERLVRAFRGVVQAEHEAAGGPPRRYLSLSHDEDGALLIRGRLPAEEGALVVAALDAAREQLSVEVEGPAQTQREHPESKHAHASEAQPEHPEAKPAHASEAQPEHAEAKQTQRGQADQAGAPTPSRAGAHGAPSRDAGRPSR
jgi:hypothetical protein